MDQKAKHIEYLVQFPHQAYVKYQKSGLEAFQTSLQELAERQQLVKVKQASIESAGIRLESQKAEVKQIQEENQRTGIGLKKKQVREKRIYVLKCRKILKHSSSLSRCQKKCQVQKQNPLAKPFYLIPDELLVQLDE